MKWKTLQSGSLDTVKLVEVDAFKPKITPPKKKPKQNPAWDSWDCADCSVGKVLSASMLWSLSAKRAGGEADGAGWLVSVAN